jgi:cell division protein FtsI/penicillin-binding protein 2
LIGKIFYLQNFEIDDNIRNSIEAVKNIEVESPRGNIYSDNGDLLVSTVVKYELRWDSKIPSESDYKKNIIPLAREIV